MTRVKPGDTVRFMDSVGEGTVVRIISDSMAEVETHDGWVLPYYINNLVPIPDPKEIHTEGPLTDPIVSKKVEIEKEVISTRLNTPPVSKPSRSKNPPREVDLHVNKLIERVVGLTNTEILGIQMEAFRKELNRAIRDNESEIIFIHGVGNGTLRGELRRTLDRDFSWCSQEDASFKEYGFGATRVRIPQNKPF